MLYKYYGGNNIIGLGVCVKDDHLLQHTLYYSVKCNVIEGNV